MSHEVLATLAERLSAHQRRVMEHERSAAVLVPIIDDGGPLRLILTRRAAAMSKHSGEVAFPGGFHEPGDASPEETALREAREEIGLRAGDVDVLGVMDDFPPLQSKVRVTPVVARIHRTPRFVLNPSEVARVFEVPLRALAQRDGWTVKSMERHGRTWPVYYYDHDGETIWGLTGYIALHMLGFTPLGSPYPVYSPGQVPKPL